MFRAGQNFQDIGIVFLKQFYKSPDLIIGNVIRFVRDLRNIVQSKEIFFRQVKYPRISVSEFSVASPKALLPEIASKRMRFLFLRSLIVMICIIGLQNKVKNLYPAHIREPEVHYRRSWSLHIHRSRVGKPFGTSFSGILFSYLPV